MVYRIIQFAVIFTLCSFAAYAQTQSNCRQSFPTPPNVKPGVSGSLTLTHDGKTLLVVSELYPSKEALDADGGGAADAMHETFGQLDELLGELASKS